MSAKKGFERIRFDFTRSPFFRVVHSNGAWGGITPRRELSITFFSERFPIPGRVTHQLVDNSRLGREISRDTPPDSVQREWEVEVLMSMEEAVNLHRWIGTKIDEWRKVDLSIPQDTPPEAL